MSDSFADGFCLKLQGILEPEQIKQVKDLLNVYIANYDIEPITTDLAIRDYQLPDAYYIYMATKEQDGKMKAGTKRQYEMCLEKLLFRFCLPLDQITINHLRLFLQEISINQKTGGHISKATLNQRKNIIRSFFSWLYEEEYIEKDPSKRIRPERADSKPREAFGDEQIEKMRAACQTARERAIIDLLVSSGIRISECVGLDITNVDLEKREVVVFGKGEKWRTSYIDAAAVVSIRRYLATRSDNNKALFVTSREPHKRLSPAAVRRSLKKLSEVSGVPNIIPHRFRHTMATKAINSGMPIESVQSILGHSEINTTMNYAHVSSDKAKMDHKRYMQ